MRTFDLTWGDLQIFFLLSHCYIPEEKQCIILAARDSADQMATRPQKGHAVLQVGNDTVPDADPQ